MSEMESWIDECCEFGPGYRSTIQSLVDSYGEWQVRRGRNRGVSKWAMGRYMRGLSGCRETWSCKVRRAGAGPQKRGLGGVRLRNRP